MVAPISMINIHIIFEIPILHPIDPFHLTICLLMKCYNKWYPALSNKYLQKLAVNFVAWLLLTISILSILPLGLYPNFPFC
jgi:hypothetical protein